MKKKIIVLMVAPIMLLLGVAYPAAENKKESPSRKVWSARAAQNDYRIGAGDVLEVTTWKEPDLSRDEVLVRTDGKISFPMLNDVQAAGLSPLELKTSMEQGLKEFVEGPFVTITVRNPGSQKVYVLGEVQNTGEYPLIKKLTVLQAFALAGGFTEWASKKEIILLRDEGGKEKIYRINYKEITRGRDLSQNLKLKADDTIIVP